MTYAIEFYTEVAGMPTRLRCALSGYRTIEAAVKAAVDYLRQTRYTNVSAAIIEEGLFSLRLREVKL